MIKFIAMLDTPVWIIIVTVLVIYIVSLRRRIAGYKDPVLLLPKSEREDWAREQLAQRREDRDVEQFQRNNDIVFGPRPTHQGE